MSEVSVYYFKNSSFLTRSGSMDLLRQTLMKQMISTTPRNASKPPPAMGTMQVQQRTAVAKPTRTCVIRIESSA